MSAFYALWWASFTGADASIGNSTCTNGMFNLTSSILPATAWIALSYR
jgi:hypothetical protein